MLWNIWLNYFLAKSQHYILLHLHVDLVDSVLIVKNSSALMNGRVKTCACDGTGIIGIQLPILIY